MAENQDNTRNQSTSNQSATSGSQGQDVRRKPSTGTQSVGSQGGQGSQAGSSGDYSFRCKDAGHAQCNWETRGRSEDEVLRNVEPHAREHHGISSFGEVRDKVRGLIRRVAA